MSNSATKYPKKSKKNRSYELKDIATALEYGSVDADRRVQLKMPSFVVDQLDAAFPNTDRSKVITKLVVEALLRNELFAEKDLQMLAQEEQHDMDSMWQYLEEREAT